MDRPCAQNVLAFGQMSAASCSRKRMPVAHRANCLDAIDTVTPEYQPNAARRKHAQLSAQVELVANAQGLFHAL